MTETSVQRAEVRDPGPVTRETCRDLPAARRAKYVPRKGHCFNATHKASGRRDRGNPLVAVKTRDGMVTAIDNNGNERHMYENIWQFQRVAVASPFRDIANVPVGTGGKNG